HPTTLSARIPSPPAPPLFPYTTLFRSDQSQGDTIVTIDGDLQDDPSEIPRLLAKLDEGFDLVTGWKTRRRDPLTRRVLSRIFNRSEEHTSELQSLAYLVCRLLLEKKKK